MRVTRAQATIALGATAGIALLLVIGLAAVVEWAGIDAYVQHRLLPAWSRKLGRQVTVGEVRTPFWPRPHAQMKRLVVAGLSGEPPLAVVEEASAGVELWRLVRSLGKDIRITHVALEGASLNLVHAEGEGWTARDVAGSIRGDSSWPEVTVDRIGVTNGRVAIYERRLDAGVASPVTALEAIQAILGTGTGGAGSLTLKAALASGEANVDVDLALLPRQVRGRITAKRMELARLRGALPGRLGDLLSAGLVSFAGEIATDSAGKYVLKGKASTDELALRGQPASAHTDLTAAINPENLEEFVLEAQGIGVEGPGIRLGGNGAMRGSPLEARIDLRGPLLDLDTLLSVQAAAPGSAELLPPSVRAALADVTVSATLGVDRVVRGGLTATDLRAKGELTRGVLTLSECAAHLYGGESDLSGTRIDFSVPRPDWQLAARLQNVDLGAAMIEVARRRPMDARLAAEVTLHGQGDQWPELRDTMSGHVQTTLSGAVIHIDFGGRIAAALRAMLDGVGMGNVIPELGLGPSTALGDVSLGGTIGGGWMRLDHPVRVAGAFGSASFDGRVGVDTRLDLKGKVRLLPALVARLVAGRPGPRAGLELPVEVTGTLPDPEVKLPTAPAELVRLLVGGAPTPGQVLGEAQRRLRELLGAGR